MSRAALLASQARWHTCGWLAARGPRAERPHAGCRAVAGQAAGTVAAVNKRRERELVVCGGQLHSPAAEGGQEGTRDLAGCAPGKGALPAPGAGRHAGQAPAPRGQKDRLGAGA